MDRTAPSAFLSRQSVSLVRVGTAHLGMKALPQLREAIRTQVSQESIVVVDLGGVETIDSGGLGALVATLRFCEPKTVVLGNTPARVSDAVQLAKLDKLFPTCSWSEELEATQNLLALQQSMSALGEALAPNDGVSSESTKADEVCEEVGIALNA